MADISKIKLQDNSVYNLKDQELRHMINVLLGIEPSDDKTEEEISEDDNKSL